MRTVLYSVLLTLLVACEPPPVPKSSQSSPKPEMGPGQVDDALIAAIQSRRYEEAYRLMTTAYRNTVSLSTFRAAVKKNAYLNGSTGIGCSKLSTTGDTHYRECILHSDLGDTHAQLYYAIDDGEWRMTGMLLGGTPAFPGFDPVADEPTPERPTESERENDTDEEN